MIMEVKKYQFQGNEPILLNDPSRVWVIDSGTVALFAAKVQDGAIIGTRRYLFSLGSGQVLLGSANQHYQILAVPIGDVQLMLYNQQYFSQLIADTTSTFISNIQDWLKQFSSIINDFTAPIGTLAKVPQQSELSLDSGEIFKTSGDSIYWIKIKEGTVSYLGLNELILNKTTQIFPVSYLTWLEVVDEVQFTIVPPSELSVDDIIEGFGFLHEQLLHLVPILNDLEAQSEYQRLELRQRLNSEMTAKALTELASPLISQKVEDSDSSDPLLVVAGAVGKAMGVAICPAANSENPNYLKNPLEAIARASRLRLRRVALRNNWWEKGSGPLIAYIADNERPVALLPVSATSYELFDPVEQKRQIVSESVVATLAPFAHIFYRPLPYKIITAWDLIRFALKGRERDILMILLTASSVMLLGMLTPGATAIIIDKVIPNQDNNLLAQIGIGLLVAALAIALLDLTQGFALLRIEAATDIVTQAAVWDRLLKEPVSFFRQYTVGDLQSRVFSVSTIRRHLSGRVLLNFISSFFALFFFVQLLSYSLILALVALSVAIITFAFTTFFSVIILRRSPPLLECQGELFGQTVQLINGISKLHIAGAQERAFASWSKNYSQQIKLEGRKRRVEEVIIIFNTVMPTITNIVLFLFVINLLPATNSTTPATHGLSLGAFIAFNTAFNSFIGGSTNLSNTFTDILQIIPLWKRTQPILKAIPEVSLKKTDPGRLTGKISINQLSFRYRKDGVATLSDINISIEPGEFIAFVGSSGSGKSTLLRLLLGFETYESGSICYDNQDLSGLDIDAVRRQMGVVLQNTQLQAASIYENIGGGASITLEEAWEAAFASGLASDIQAMPMQMHTVISEGGGNLSGGQRQRLVIARALALKPRILLFDEATSALDNKTQAIVSTHLDKLNVTRVVIAHRLSTIRNADRIYVLQEGKIVQQGNFDELTSQPGLFAQLMARQNL
jgi:NHLM bacteriocin system ABC transporter ATP-binding protein